MWYFADDHPAPNPAVDCTFYIVRADPCKITAAAAGDSDNVQRRCGEQNVYPTPKLTFNP